MQKGIALLAAAAFLAAGLAGCSSSSKGGFTVKAPGAAGGEYVFTANGSADNYTWDLGDRLTVLYGKSVHHAYDFKNGKITVALTTKKGTQTAESRQDLTLGTGQNAQPTFFLEAPTNWTIPGESMTFTAKASKDPDGDPLRYSWSCVRVQDAVRLPTHTHPGFGGVPFATPPAGTVTAQTLVGPVPAADRKISGDLCDALGSGGHPSTDATIQGSFSKTGIYDIYLLASDPVHPSTSGKFHLAVTAPGERPAAIQDFGFFDTFEGGTGSLQSFCDATGNCGHELDMAVHSFSLPLNGKGGYVVASLNGTSAVPVPGNLTWKLERGTIQIATGVAPGNVTIPATETKASSYTLTLTYAGAGDSTAVHVVMALDMDPFKVY
jgi:hypothetical protein